MSPSSDSGGVALIVIDMLNRYDHDDAEPLMRSVREIVGPLRSLIDEARERDVLTVWVNDNHGDWAAGRSELVDYALGGRDPSLVEPIAPTHSVPFVVKARHSIFYETQLEYLLREQGAERLILTGQVTEQCILYSALDAYVRHFEVAVARDAVAHIHPDLADAALRMMELNMSADVLPGTECLAIPAGRG
jgi:nicotinamidase-related amidase